MKSLQIYVSSLLKFVSPNRRLDSPEYHISSIGEKYLMYLKNGSELIYMMGGFNDEVAQVYKNGGLAFYTDGYWVWDSTLIYHFEAYDIPLPEDFIKFMESSNFYINLQKLADLDESVFDEPLELVEYK